MQNHQITDKFFNLIGEAKKNFIVEFIAGHCQISNQHALEEILEEGALPLLDYLTGSFKKSTGVLMKLHGLV